MILPIFLIIPALPFLVDGCAPDITKTTKSPRTTTRKVTTQGTTQPPVKLATQGIANLEIVPSVIFSYAEAPVVPVGIHKKRGHRRVKRELTTTTTTTTMDPITDTTSTTTEVPIEPVPGQPETRQEAFDEIYSAIKSNVTDALLKHHLGANVTRIEFTFTPDLPIPAIQGDFCDATKTNRYDLTKQYILCGEDPFVAKGEIVIDLDESIDQQQFEDVFREMFFDLTGDLFDIFEKPTFQFK